MGKKGNKQKGNKHSSKSTNVMGEPSHWVWFGEDRAATSNTAQNPETANSTNPSSTAHAGEQEEEAVIISWVENENGTRDLHQTHFSGEIEQPISVGWFTSFVEGGSK